MFQSKIASLEARIARLESRLQGRSKQAAFSYPASMMVQILNRYSSPRTGGGGWVWEERMGRNFIGNGPEGVATVTINERGEDYIVLIDFSSTSDISIGSSERLTFPQGSNIRFIGSRIIAKLNEMSGNY